jgi:hypothetical protein
MPSISQHHLKLPGSSLFERIHARASVEHGACHVAYLVMTGNDNRKSPAKALRPTSEARATLGKLVTQD